MNHTNTGPTASAWSNANNWLPTDVPGTLSEVQISNGGEAVVDVSVDVTRIEVGTTRDYTEVRARKSSCTTTDRIGLYI